MNHLSVVLVGNRTSTRVNRLSRIQFTTQMFAVQNVIMLDTLKVTLHEPLPKETSPQKQRNSTVAPLKIGKFVLHIRTVHSREAIFFYRHLVDSVFLFCFVYLHVKNHHVAIEIVICPPIRVTSTSSRERVLALG